MSNKLKTSFVGKHVIIRGSSSGVHFGVLEEFDGGCVVVLSQSRRLWEWHTGGTGITLSEVSICGIDQSRSKISMAMPMHIILDAIEILECHGMAIATIEGADVAKPK